MDDGSKNDLKTFLVDVFEVFNFHLILDGKVLGYFSLLAFDDAIYILKFPPDLFGESAFVSFEKFEGLLEGNIGIGIHLRFFFIIQNC